MTSFTLGAVAETVGGAGWNQLWNQYIAEPCGLELSLFGNNTAAATDWDGNTDSLVGLDNPQIESGLATNLDDYAMLLSLHLNDGACGNNQVLSPESVAFMREQRTPPGGVSGAYPWWGNAMGWWVVPAESGGEVYLYLTAGFFGSISWIDVERGYGGLVIFENYPAADAGVTSVFAVATQLIPIIEDALDAVR